MIGYGFVSDHHYYINQGTFIVAMVFISGSSAQAPKPGFAAVAAINAAICALAKAFAEQGIIDKIQVNSVLPGPVMTSRRINFLEKWSDVNDLSMEQAKHSFLNEMHIERFGEPIQSRN